MHSLLEHMHVLLMVCASLLFALVLGCTHLIQSVGPILYALDGLQLQQVFLLLVVHTHKVRHLLMLHRLQLVLRMLLLLLRHDLHIEILLLQLELPFARLGIVKLDLVVEELIELRNFGPRTIVLLLLIA